MSNIKVFGGSSHPELTRAICERLNLPVGRANCTKFANGETKVEIQESVRGEDVFIIQVKSGLFISDHLVHPPFILSAVCPGAKRPTVGHRHQKRNIDFDKYFRLDADQI